MKVTHTLGHNSNWSIESYFEQGIGDYFLITAFNNGIGFSERNYFKKIHDISMIDLQFYGKKHKQGKLDEFEFHPANANPSEVTNVYFENCLKRAIDYQKNLGFNNIIIPHFYENEDVKDIVRTIKSINKHIKSIRSRKEKYFMTLPFANYVIHDSAKVEEILFACTDMNIAFDGYFITCENKPEFRKKLTTDLKLLKNLTRVFRTLKKQNFETIYAYANWDAMIFLAQTDIDYVTIGTYENLRNFDIKRFTEDESGGGSKGYYFSEKLLNMVRADSVTLIRETGNLDIIRNEKNIFSDIILKEGYPWNIHKPDVNKNYLLAISRLLKSIDDISNFDDRKKYVMRLINNAINNYDTLEENEVYLDRESGNYHLNVWKTYLSAV